IACYPHLPAGPMPQAWATPRPARANVAVSAALLQHVSRIGPPPSPMDTRLLKLIVTPLLIGAASLAGRRWGETVSGWFIGLPLTSGPVCWFLALEQGTGFAAAAARGCLAGAAAEAGFCLAYGVTARHADWLWCIAAGTLAYAMCAALLQVASLPLWLLALVVCAALATGLWLMPRLDIGRPQLPAPPSWDLPARMVV